jgi:hypothetical protein
MAAASVAAYLNAQNGPFATALLPNLIAPRAHGEAQRFAHPSCSSLLSKWLETRARRRSLTRATPGAGPRFPRARIGEARGKIGIGSRRCYRACALGVEKLRHAGMAMT